MLFLMQQGDSTRVFLSLAVQVAPWSKTGGLGDVLGSLPVALAERGHRVMVVVPRYACYEEPVDTEVSGPRQLGAHGQHQHRAAAVAVGQQRAAVAAAHARQSKQHCAHLQQAAASCDCDVHMQSSDLWHWLLSLPPACPYTPMPTVSPLSCCHTHLPPASLFVPPNCNHLVNNTEAHQHHGR